MSFYLYRGGSSVTKSEGEILTAIIDKLENRYSDSKDFCYLFVGYVCNGRQIDATLIRSDSIINIEVKDYSGEKAVADRQGNITILPNKILVNRERGENPFEQVRQQNFAIKNFIYEKRNDLSKSLPSQRIASSDNVDVCGFIVFRSVGSFDVEQIHHSTRTYLRVADSETFMTGSDRYHGRDFFNQSAPMQLDEQFPRKLAELLALDSVDDISEPDTIIPPATQAAIRIHLERTARSFSLDKYVNRIGLQESLLKETNLFVVGSPGSGKTTLLEMMVSQLASRQLAENRFYPIPCFVTLVDGKDIEQKVADESGLQDAEVARQLLREGKFRIVFDGVDEMVRIKENFPGLSDFLRRYPANNYIISVKDTLYNDVPYRDLLFRNLGEFKELRVEQFQPDEKIKFFRSRLGSEYYDNHAKEIEDFIESLPDETPLTLEMACEDIRESLGSLKPTHENLGLFYKRYFERRLKREVTRSKGLREGAEVQLDQVLTELGNSAIHDSIKPFKKRVVLDVIKDVTRDDPTKFFELLLRWGIIKKVKVEHDEHVQFHHYRYRDYFVANALVGKLVDEESLSAILINKDEYDSLVFLCGIEPNTNIVGGIIRSALDNGRPQLAIDCLCNTTNVNPGVVGLITDAIVSLIQKTKEEQFCWERRAYSRAPFVFQNIWRYGGRICGATLQQFMEEESKQNILWRIDWEILKWQRLRFGQIDERFLNTYRGAVFTEEGLRTDDPERGLRLGEYDGLAGCREAQTPEGHRLYFALRSATTFEQLCDLVLNQSYNHELKAFVLNEILSGCWEDDGLKWLLRQLRKNGQVLGPFGERYMWVMSSFCTLYPLDEEMEEEITKYFWIEPSPIVQFRFLWYMTGFKPSRLVSLFRRVLTDYLNDSLVDLHRLDELSGFHIAGMGDSIFVGQDEIVCDYLLDDFKLDTCEVLIKCFALGQIGEKNDKESTSLLEKLSFSDNVKVSKVAQWALAQIDS